MIEPIPPSLAALERDLGKEWKAIQRARDEASRVRRELQELLSALPPSDTSCVAFGSLARGEWTSGSDLDWTLLIDGEVDPSHSDLVFEVRSKLKTRFKEPGRGGLFGQMAFSHVIVHQVGGDNDSNRNVTQRILLLSESVPIGGPSDAYERIVKAVVRRYVEDDPSFRHGTSAGKAPRFLLNDIVRYWRTVAVDYAHKVRDRGGEGWALRNLKLRMSRKLIFAAGLLKCFLCAGWEAVEGEQTADRRLTIDMLIGLVRLTPLDTLVHAAQRFSVDPTTTGDLMDAYNRFLALLDDKEKRERLEGLSQDQADTDVLFNEAKEIARKFDRALESMFFASPGRLPELTKHYGVF